MIVFMLSWLTIGLISAFLAWKFANYDKLTIGDALIMLIFSIGGPFVTWFFLDEYFHEIFVAVENFFSRIAEITIWKKKE